MINLPKWSIFAIAIGLTSLVSVIIYALYKTRQEVKEVKSANFRILNRIDSSSTWIIKDKEKIGEVEIKTFRKYEKANIRYKVRRSSGYYADTLPVFK
jgi:hypothetical protein